MKSATYGSGTFASLLQSKHESVIILVLGTRVHTLSYNVYFIGCFNETGPKIKYFKAF